MINAKEQSQTSGVIPALLQTLQLRSCELQLLKLKTVLNSGTFMSLPRYEGEGEHL